MTEEKLRQYIETYTPRELELIKQEKKPSVPDTENGKARLLESGLLRRTQVMKRKMISVMLCAAMAAGVLNVNVSADEKKNMQRYRNRAAHLL